MNSINSFDWKFYINLYPDLIKAGIDNEIKALEHWKVNGLNEGRSCNKFMEREKRKYKDFNWMNYINNYLDLQNAGINNSGLAFLHWLNYGRLEGRDYKNKINIKVINYNLYEDINWIKYIDDYPDIKLAGINTKDDVISHYINYGEKEGRILKKNITEQNYILHITHQFGGGTMTYINNLISILSEYKHIIIYISNNKSILNSIVNFNIKYCIVHHSLYNDPNGFEIATNFFNDIINIPKIFIVHDYFLLYPTNPNPLKKYMNDNKPYLENVNNAMKYLSNFNQVIFNSRSTYNNYIKYFKLDNFKIINNIPDIQIYNNRIYPKTKTVYNIALLGHIYAVHKGRDLAIKIINLFEKDDRFKFYIFGEFNYNFPNLINCGKYDNENIFKLLQANNIDMFLFLSTAEETYSFTLSIALNTGLPIIYNSIGSYNDRLSNYNNCYPFNEDNFNDVTNILNDIIDKSNNNIQDIQVEYKLIKNIPEIRYYLNSTADCLDEYLENIKSTVIFINNNNLEIINNIKENGLYDKIDYIFIIKSDYDDFYYQDYKVKLISYNNPISIIKKFADLCSKNINILYLEEYNNSLINNYNYILDNLINHNSIGIYETNYTYLNNSWWSKSDYIKKININNKLEDKYFIMNYFESSGSFLENNCIKKQDINNNINININIVLITSKIYVSQNKLNYIDKRSIYSKDERFEQTLNTIVSIKKYIPNYFIVLIDNSDFTNEEYNKLLSEVNLFLNIKNNKKLDYYTNESEFKSYAEISQTITALYYIKALCNRFNLLNFFKITGRYTINETFNFNQIISNKFNIFKINKNIKDREYIYTCFYKITNTYFNNYINHIEKIYNEIQSSNKYDNLDLETYLPKNIENKQLINNLGITQNISVWHDNSNI